MTDNNSINRRDFLKGVTLTSLGMAFAVSEMNAEAQGAAAAPAQAPAGPPVNCAVIGLGPQGREILNALAKMPNGPVVALCDTYKAPAYLKRSTDIAPNATLVDDYRKVLEMPNVQAVFIATPTHLHKQMALDALAAGKHVYCEAPLAVDLAEAKEIAKAGTAAKTLFQPGLQYRANKMHNHVYANAIKAQWMGKVAQGRAQWQKKTSWRAPAPTPEREKELNWRLVKATSLGLPGEVGIHQFDIATWYYGALPVSVTGFGGILNWADGREVPDTVQCVLEYPQGVNFMYNATLVSSFDGAYESFLGADSSVLIRDQRAWMFKETDSPLLGWEVYARKDDLKVGEDKSGTGIALVADATQLMAQGKEPGKVGQDVTKTALYQAVSAFLTNVGGPKEKAHAPTALDGYQANVVAAKVHEAILNGTKIAFQKEWFEL